jgi:hypothetical protein
MPNKYRTNTEHDATAPTGAVSKPTGLGMVSYSYFNFQLLQTVAKGFNLLQPMDSAVPASALVANCCNLFQTVADPGKG